uniref:DNA repair and recombination protein RAD54-like n=1 Tax=Dermatophagoides pteronyssinus TaxID=6956 RepID=A0A6P6YA05_DERPT|nr:DNA excision repair protein ERCC-6-like [Dermatophagoides pteronyssinus]
MLQYSKSNTSDKLKLVEFEGYLIPLFFLNVLKPYQKEGLQWLLQNYELGISCILADDMGLGKTIQVIAFLSVLIENKTYLQPGSCSLTNYLDDLLKKNFKDKNKIVDSMLEYSDSVFSKRVLIITCTTLLYQLEAEFLKFYPLIHIKIHKSTSSLTQNIKELGIHVFEMVILDEGQKIKNPNGLTTLAIKRIKSKFKLILTGTPFQNSFRELWSLIDFINPGLLGSLPAFQMAFISPIEDGFTKGMPLDKKLFAKKCLTLLRGLLTAHILRRTKTDSKILNNIQCAELMCLCPITAIQYKLYINFLKEYGPQFLKNITALNSVQKDTKNHSLKYFNILSILSNHPDALFENLEEFEYRIHKNNLTYGDYERSGKLKVVLQLLKKFELEGQKVVIFSQRIKYLNFIENYISSSYKYLKLDGSVTSYQKRTSMIDNFNTNSDIRVFLMSTKIGGVGINLCSASRVIIFDPDWNPANDSQALNRCYRIGQSCNVEIYRLISATPFEQYMYRIQKQKLSIANAVFDEGVIQLSKRDLTDLLEYPNPIDPSSMLDFNSIAYRLLLTALKNKISFNDPISDPSTVFTEHSEIPQVLSEFDFNIIIDKIFQNSNLAKDKESSSDFADLISNLNRINEDECSDVDYNDAYTDKQAAVSNLFKATGSLVSQKEYQAINNTIKQKLETSVNSEFRSFALSQRACQAKKDNELVWTDRFDTC